MQNRNRKNSGMSGTFGIGVIALIMLLNLSTGAVMGGRNIAVFVAIIIVLGAVGAFAGILLAKKKSSAKPVSGYHAERAKESAKRMFMREEFEEKTVKCAHPRGKEKYFHQLDNFLSTGLIDKKEYQVLKARYEKLNIPEDMH